VGPEDRGSYCSSAAEYDISGQRHLLKIDQKEIKHSCFTSSESNLKYLLKTVQIKFQEYTYWH